MDKLKVFVALSKLFKEHHFSLYLVGGTVRDFLLNKNIDDMDAVTDATPIEMKEFLEGDYTFEKMGSIKCKFEGVKFDITTLRKEKKYRDSRHPLEVTFIKNLKEDHVRRDFTVNAMYLDDTFQLYDYENGLEDLNNKILRMVGSPKKRLKEDPLRIIRCLRFALLYDFSIESHLEKALRQSVKYLSLISIDKIKMEMKKFKGIDNKIIEETFEKYSIKHLIDVIE